MQSHDAPFQTGSASHSPGHAPGHHGPSGLASFPDAPTATASPASASPHHPPAARMDRLSRSCSGSNSPGPAAAPSHPPGAAHHAPRPDREDASTSHRSPALSRHRSASTASDVPIPAARTTTTSSGGPSRADKGKGVVRDGPVGQGHAQNDPDEQQRRVERVLQRAEASRLARAFRNRLALASYKASRGWHDVGLDTIEPHLEQEAQRRSQGPTADSTHPAPRPPAPQQHYPSQPLPHQAYAPHPHQPVYQQEHPPAYDMDAVLGAPTPASHPHKRARLDDPYQPARSRPAPQPQQQQQADMYSAHSVYAPPPQPVHTVSPYSTASVYHREPAGPASARALYAPQPDDGAQPTGAAARKQRALAPAPASTAAAAGAGSPSSRSRRVPSRRSSPAKGSGSRPGDALSSSDPTFSSFVDAATALTGMARAPSDPSSQGSGSDEGGGGARSVATRGMEVDVDGQGAGEAGEVGGDGDGDGSARAPFARPATPERQIVKLDGAPVGLGAPGGGSAGANDSGTAEGAAELMLYLAASPSPVQSRKAPPTTLGDGSGIKGRRLFSGMGMSAGDDAPAPGAGPGQDPGSIFGGELGGAHPSGPLDAPFATSSSAPISAPLEPVKSGGATSTPSGVFGGGGSGAGPATPGRQRQPSLGGAASWELFINASPSPKRGGPNGGAGAAAGAGMGTRGASPPHAAIGA